MKRITKNIDISYSDSSNNGNDYSENDYENDEHDNDGSDYSDSDPCDDKNTHFNIDQKECETCTGKIIFIDKIRICVTDDKNITEDDIKILAGSIGDLLSTECTNWIKQLKKQIVHVKNSGLYINMAEERKSLNNKRLKMMKDGEYDGNSKYIEDDFLNMYKKELRIDSYMKVLYNTLCRFVPDDSTRKDRYAGFENNELFISPKIYVDI